MPVPINKIENISGVLLKPVTTSQGTRALPVLNSLVDIKILEVSVNNVRMLIDGKVFVSKFPGLAQRNENFIARVINLNPFTLSLNLAGSKAILNEAEIIALLTKLNIPDTPLSRKIIRSLISEKKPVEKSRLEELIDHLNKNDIDPDEQQLMIILRASGNSDFKQFINETDNWVFKNSVEDIAGEIFNSVCFLMNSNLTADILSAIKESLVLDPETTQDLSGFILSKRGTQFEDLIKTLASFNADLISEEAVRKEFIKLKENISRYRTLQNIYYEAGIFPGIIIMKYQGTYELIQYGFQKEQKQLDTLYKIKIDAAPENLGEIKINSFVGSGSLFVDFHTSNNTIEYLRSTEKELSESVRKNLMLSPFIKYSTLKNNSVKFKSSEAVNVKV